MSSNVMGISSPVSSILDALPGGCASRQSLISCRRYRLLSANVVSGKNVRCSHWEALKWNTQSSLFLDSKSSLSLHFLFFVISGWSFIQLWTVSVIVIYKIETPTSWRVYSRYHDQSSQLQKLCGFIEFVWTFDRAFSSIVIVICITFT